MTREQEHWHNLAEENYKTNVQAFQMTEISELENFPKDQQELFKNSSTFQTITICKGQSIPRGFVIIGQTTNFSCSMSLDNAWIIKRPRKQETICKSSPIPTGYVIIGQTTNFGCSNSLDNAWVIKLPTQREVICKSSPMPSGYVIIGQTTNFGCTNSLDNAWVIQRV